MAQKIIGAFMIIACCLGTGLSVWHLVCMLKIPKEERLWWGNDVLMQLYYPIYIFGIVIGVYQF